MRLDPRIWRRLAWAVPAGLAAFALARWWRGYEWQLAWITGFALGVLTFVALRTLDHMRDVVRRH
jgi:hypothetical protein